MKRTGVIAALAAIAALAGCRYSHGSADIAALRAQVAALQQEVERAKVSEEERDSLVWRVWSLEQSRTEYASAAFRPSSIGSYQRVDTIIGPALISLEDIQPFADGSRVTLHIGNPSTADISGVTLTVKWRRKSADGAERSEEQKDVEVVERLRSGVWNVVRVTLPGVPPDQLDRIETSMSVNQVYMRYARGAP